MRLRDLGVIAEATLPIGPGFTAITGAGGYVNFYVEPYEMLHRSFIYAPGNKTGERFELAARMMQLPNGGKFLPPSWVPRDVAATKRM